MSDFTKVNVRKDLYELIKIQAAADGRSVTNFIERLLRASVNDLKPSDPEANIRQAKSQKEAELKLKGEKETI